MGTSHSLGEFNVKLDALVRAWEDLPSKQVKVSARIAEAAIRGAAPERLRNFGKRGTKLSVRTSFTGAGRGATAVLAGTPKGAWSIIEYGTKPHPIPRLSGSSSRAARPMLGPAFGGFKSRKMLRTPYGPRRTVWHPGTKGQHPWEKGTAGSLPAIHAALDHAGTAVLHSIF